MLVYNNIRYAENDDELINSLFNDEKGTLTPFKKIVKKDNKTFYYVDNFQGVIVFENGSKYNFSYPKPYFTRKKIDVKLIRSIDGLIKITDNTTDFFTYRKEKPESLDSIVADFYQLKKECKKKGIRLCGQKKIAILKSKYPEYLKTCDKIDSMAEHIFKLYSRILKRGIRDGWSDDKSLNKIIFPLQKELDSVRRSSDVMDIFHNVRHDIEKALFSVKHEKNLYSVGV